MQDAMAGQLGRHDRRKASEVARTRQELVQRAPLSHHEFVDACGVSYSNWAELLARVIREYLGSAGKIPPENVMPDDRFDGPLGQVCIWPEFGPAADIRLDQVERLLNIELLPWKIDRIRAPSGGRRGTIRELFLELHELIRVILPPDRATPAT